MADLKISQMPPFVGDIGKASIPVYDPDNPEQTFKATLASEPQVLLGSNGTQDISEIIELAVTVNTGSKTTTTSAIVPANSITEWAAILITSTITTASSFQASSGSDAWKLIGTEEIDATRLTAGQCTTFVPGSFSSAQNGETPQPVTMTFDTNPSGGAVRLYLKVHRFIPPA
jgi:hypothetical protein